MPVALLRWICLALAVSGLGCAGQSFPLSAQQGSTVTIGFQPDGSTPVAYGSPQVGDPQRGELVYFLDSYATANELTTRASTKFKAAAASQVGRDPNTTVTFVGNVLAARQFLDEMLVSWVDIPLAAPLGEHDLYVQSRLGGQAQGSPQWLGTIAILPHAVDSNGESIVGTTTLPTPVSQMRKWVPDPTLVIPLGQTVHAVKLRVYTWAADQLEAGIYPPGPSRVDVVDAIETPETTSYEPALAWHRWVAPPPGPLLLGYHDIEVVSSDSDGFSEIGLVFRLTSSARLVAENVWVEMSAWDVNGNQIVSDATLDSLTFSIR